MPGELGPPFVAMALPKATLPESPLVAELFRAKALLRAESGPLSYRGVECRNSFFSPCTSSRPLALMQAIGEGD